MECSGCNYTGSTWTVEVCRTYTGTLDSTATVHVEGGDDYEEETIVKCPECGEWQDEVGAEIERETEAA